MSARARSGTRVWRGMPVLHRSRRPVRAWPQLREPGWPERRLGGPDRRTGEQVGEREAASRPATVLVVEDSDAVRRITARMLREEEWTVLEAADGVEALALCAQHPVAVVVTDIRMPRMDGLELGQRIAAQWPHVRTMFITGYPDVEACLLPDRYLLKPFDASELVAIVRSLVASYWRSVEGDGPDDQVTP